jgi:hypothetical protein
MVKVFRRIHVLVHESGQTDLECSLLFGERKIHDLVPERYLPITGCPKSITVFPLGRQTMAAARFPVYATPLNDHDRQERPI